MKYINKIDAPEILNGASNIKNFHKYAKDIKQSLLKEFNNKCGYCERQLRGDTDSVIDHFYPKSKYPDKALDWENLILSCHHCNNLKMDKFPLDNENKPLLINPLVDNPIEHIKENDSGFLTHLTEKGKTTIEIFKLNQLNHNSINENKNIKYWHMQLHPDNQGWNNEVALLSEFSLIGLGKTKSENAYSDFKKMSINDIVLIKNGQTPIAIVEVIGYLEEISENKDETLHLDWFKYRRKVSVLEYANESMEPFPQPRGTLNIAIDKSSDSYKYIDNWYKSIHTINDSITIPKQININDAKPAFGVESVANILSSVIINIPERSGMMVGIFGKWGRGKTYLVNEIWNNIDERNDLNYYRVDFSAWKYQDTKESWAYLYERMTEEYLEEKKDINFIVKFFKKYSRLWKLNLQKHKWTSIISFILISSILIYWTFYVDKLNLFKFIIGSFGFIFSLKIFLFYLKQKSTAIGLFNKYFSNKSFSDYLGLQAEVENELENLVKTWIPKENSKEKIILFVDDIDRCNINQIINIIDGLRVILDNEEIHKRLIIVTAIDEKILENALNHKYETMGQNDISEMYKEYLEKVFIIGIKLNQLEDNEIEEFIEKVLPELHTNDDTLKEKTKISHEVVDNNQKAENISSSYNNIEINDLNNMNDKNDENNSFDLDEKERKYLIESIKELNNATPRRIKIFYYKYLILKKLLENRLSEKGSHASLKRCGEKVVIDALLHISNNKSLSDFEHDKMDDKRFKEALEYTTIMVSAL